MVFASEDRVASVYLLYHFWVACLDGMVLMMMMDGGWGGGCRARTVVMVVVVRL